MGLDLHLGLKQMEQRLSQKLCVSMGCLLLAGLSCLALQQKFQVAELGIPMGPHSLRQMWGMIFGGVDLKGPMSRM